MKTLNEFTPGEIKAAVASHYSEVAQTPQGKFNFPVGRGFAEDVGYDAALLDCLPCTIWESFTGAGNPQPFIDAQLRCVRSFERRNQHDGKDPSFS